MTSSKPRFRHRAAAVVVGLCVLALLLADARAADLESRAREIDNKLMAPCCGANTVREHDSGPAMQMRAEIRRLLAEGKSEQEILDHFVAIHGDKILALPEAQGFNLLAYLLPAAFLLFGAVFLAMALRRWRAQPSAPAPATGPQSNLDPVYLERLRDEVRKET